METERGDAHRQTHAASGRSPPPRCPRSGTRETPVAQSAWHLLGAAWFDAGRAKALW